MIVKQHFSAAKRTRGVFKPPTIRSYRVVSLLSGALLCSCSGDFDLVALLNAPRPIAIASIQPLPEIPLGATIQLSEIRDATIRVRATAADNSETLSTPWQSADSPLVVLGFKAAQTYSLQVERLYDGRLLAGPATTYTAPPLPAGLSQVNVDITGHFTGGYSMAPISGIDGDGYLIIFDSVGTIRWYRDFGPQPISAASQQQDGHFTAFVGASTGFNMTSGTYVEVTRTGDSLRTVSAVGSPYTDPHELLEDFDHNGVRRADYLFGYNFRAIDRTAIGGGPSDIIAVHQVLRISTAGTVDTLIAGDDHWDAADHAAPFVIADLDHPNSIDFDLDGGVIVSYRDLSAIVKVDPHTHRLVWQFGGTDNQFTISGDPLGGFDSQHTARVLPNGHLLIFDNGWSHSPQQSRAVEYALDAVAKTATMVWQYSASPPIFNDFTGSAQRLANGNTLVAFTRHGIVDEVGPDAVLIGRASIEFAPGKISTPYRVIRINNLYSFERP